MYCINEEVKNVLKINLNKALQMQIIRKREQKPINIEPMIINNK